MRRLALLLVLASAALGQAQSALDLLRSPQWQPALAKLVAEKDRLGPEVVAALRHSEAEVRRRAAEALAMMDLRAAAPDLVKAARDEDPAVRREAVLSLATVLRVRKFGYHGEPSALPRELKPLIELGSEVVPVLLELSQQSTRTQAAHGTRIAALRALKELKDPRSIEPLMVLVKRLEGFILEEAMEALAAHGDPRVVPALLGSIDEEIEWYEGTPAMWVLARMEGRALPELLDAFEDPRWASARARVAKLLGSFGDPRAADVLHRAVGDPDVEVRAAVMDALGRIGQPGSRAFVVAGLEDGDPTVRAAAANSAGRMGLVECAPKVWSMLKDPSARVRLAVVSALPDVDPKGAAALLPLIQGDRALQRVAFEFLHRLKPPAAEGAMLSLLTTGEEWVVQEAARFLGEIRSEAAVPELIRLLGADAWTSGNAAQALAEIGAPATDRLLELLPTAVGTPRYRILSALGGGKDPRVFDALLKELGDPEMLGAVSNALGRLGDPRAIPPLLSRLQTAGTSMINVVEALGDLRAAEAVEPLMAILAEGGYTACFAARALGKIGEKRALEPILNLIDGIRTDEVGRWIAIDALGYYEGPAIVERLLVFLKGPHQDRQGAILGLGRVGGPSVLPTLERLFRTADEPFRSEVEVAIAAIRARG